MKIILSRKGFDSSYGGCASPVIDGKPIPLPIPLPKSPVSYKELHIYSYKLGDLVTNLSGAKTTADMQAHLDPDLIEGAIFGKKMEDGWLPAFGQSDQALSHLDRQGVGPGDLFLFFGWYKNAEKIGDHFRFVRNANDHHLIFGWLQIDSILRIGKDPGSITRKYPWLKDHPHLHDLSPKNNAIYIAKDKLSIPGLPCLEGLPGGGVFNDVTDLRVLTEPGQGLRSKWVLPNFFWPVDQQIPLLSYHSKPVRWRKSTSENWHLQSVAKGQEFVYVPPDEAASVDMNLWLKNIFSEQKPV